MLCIHQYLQKNKKGIGAVYRRAQHGANLFGAIVRFETRNETLAVCGCIYFFVNFRASRSVDIRKNKE